MKEEATFVSLDFNNDLNRSTQTNAKKNPLLKEFVLPDFKTVKKGYFRDYEAGINPMLLSDKELKEQL